MTPATCPAITFTVTPRAGVALGMRGVTGARASQALFGQIASLERTARLYAVLGDRKLLDLYRAQDLRLSATVGQLQATLSWDIDFWGKNRAAQSAAGNTAITSSPIIFTTRPPLSRHAWRMIARQRSIVDSASASPRLS